MSGRNGAVEICCEHVGALGTEVVLAPTRSRLLGTVSVRGPGGDVDGLAVDVDCLSILVPAEALRARVAEAPAEIRIDAVGERPRVLALRPLDHRANRVATRTVLEDWLLRRRQDACGDSAKQYFLQIDLETSPLFLTARGRATDFVGQTQQILFDRVATLGTRRLVSVANKRVDLTYARELSRSFFSAQRTFLPDLAELEDAYERFAGGQLRQDCAFLPNARSVIAGDADSGMVFLFAELPFALRDAAADSTLPPAERCAWRMLYDAWAPLVNCLVRMQEIFLWRFVHGGGSVPEEFMRLEYAPVPPARDFAAAALRIRAAHEGLSVDELRLLMIRRLQALAGPGGLGFGR